MTNSPQNNSNTYTTDSHANFTQNSAYLATPESVIDPSWYLDSGATNHITSDINNLSIRSNYKGTDKLIVGNGHKLDISHVGDTLVQSHTQPFKKLHLKNILHVPQITKNLLSISKFTFDNKATAEFYADKCVIKDIKTRKILLQGVLRDGLYCLEFVGAPQAHFTGSSRGRREESQVAAAEGVDCPSSSNKAGLGPVYNSSHGLPTWLL